MNQNIYIKSIEASSIWESMNRSNRPILVKDFDGMIPYSLMSIKLKQVGLIDFAEGNKRISYDVINVKFNSSVKSGDKILENVPQWIKWKEEKIKSIEGKLAKETKVKTKSLLEGKLHNLEVELESLHNLKAELEINSNLKKSLPCWEEIGLNDLRKELYVNGFDIEVYDKKKKGFVNAHFVLFLRSSAKSRKGEVWFIREDLHKEMARWSNMGLDFDKEKVDLAGLMAYESLTTSSIIDTIKIDPESILIIDKVVSKFKHEVDIIDLDDDGMLKCTPDVHEIENEIFDGEALLDTSLFTGNLEGKGFVLLRESFFKAAAINANLQSFFKDYFKNEYDTATVQDMFGKDIPVKQIKMVINPSNLKCLKFAYAIGSKKEMWNYWKKFVHKENGNLFGICKYEKETKRVDADEAEKGIKLQQLSYQMINSLPCSKEQIEQLAQFEIDYIDSLKNDPERLMMYLDRTKNSTNANQMFIDIYNVNPGIIETQIFRDFKKHVILKYKKQLQSGKIRVNGDYAVMGGNLVEYLFASVGKIKGEIKEPLALKGNQIYTTLLSKGDVAGFRNPHVSPANCLLADNVELDKKSNPYHDYFKYFTLTDNIVVVNSIKNPLPDTLNGSDFDSDTVLLTNQKTITTIIKDTNGKYLIPVNKIPLNEDADNVNYRLTNKDKAKVDNKLSLSQKRIGQITNAGQLALSLMWNESNERKPDENLIDELMKIVNSLAVCSGLAIDGAKREYKLDVDKQIRHYKKELNKKLLTYQGKAINSRTGKDKVKSFKYYPKFWEFVRDKKKKEDITVQKETEQKETEQKDNPKDKKEAKKVRTKWIETKESRKKRKKLIYNTPMDWLIITLNEKIKRSEGVENPKELVDILIDGRIKDGNRRKQANVENLAIEHKNELNHINAVANEDNEDETLTRIENVMEKYSRKISKIKMDEKTMYAMLAKISKRTESEDNNKNKDGKPYPNLQIMLNLYKAYPEVFLKTFKNE